MTTLILGPLIPSVYHIGRHTKWTQDTKRVMGPWHDPTPEKVMNLVPIVVLIAALLGCTTDGPEAVREGFKVARVGRRLWRMTVQKLKAAVQRQPTNPCPCVQEHREHVRGDWAALDVFRNSTDHEEYRPS